MAVESLGRSGLHTPAAPSLSAKGRTAPQLDDKVRAAREALDAVASNMAQQRKAFARQSVDQLKKQLDRLSQVPVIEPEGMARFVRGMMKQLGGAVRDYAQSGDPRALRAEADRTQVLDDADTEFEKAFVKDARRLRRRMEVTFGHTFLAAAARDGKSWALQQLVSDVRRDRAASVRNEQLIASWSSRWSGQGAAPLVGAIDLKV